MGLGKRVGGILECAGLRSHFHAPIAKYYFLEGAIPGALLCDRMIRKRHASDLLDIVIVRDGVSVLVRHLRRIRRSTLPEQW